MWKSHELTPPHSLLFVIDCIYSLITFCVLVLVFSSCATPCFHTFFFPPLATILVQHLGRWILEIPSLPSVHYTYYCSAFFFPFLCTKTCLLSLRLSFSSSFTLCFLLSLKMLLVVIKNRP